MGLDRAHCDDVNIRGCAIKVNANRLYTDFFFIAVPLFGPCLPASFYQMSHALPVSLVLLGLKIII
jgi:hypothetical protein